MACNLTLPVCTPADIFRQQLWRGFLGFEELNPEVIEVLKKVNILPPEEFIKLLRATPGNIPCFVDQLELYRDGDCSEINQIRKCLLEYTKIRDWGQSPSQSFLNILKSVTPKDYIVPSDALLNAFKQFAGEKFFPHCFYKEFSLINYCRLAAPVCNKTPQWIAAPKVFK